MPSCWEHLSWERLWHKPKQMLIAEPYAASVHWPWPPWPEALPHTLPVALGLHFSPASGTSPALRDAGDIPVPKLLFELSVWIGLAAGWWPLGCHLTQTADWHRETLQVRLVSPLVYTTKVFEHFLFQGLTLILVFWMVWLQKFLRINLFQHPAEML